MTIVSDWDNFCQEVPIDWCLQKEGKIGEGKIVEIYNGKFEKMKIVSGGLWKVTGCLVESAGRPQAVSWFPRKKGTAKLCSLLSRTRLNSKLTSSQCWKVYDCLSHKGFQHLTVNHSAHFKDPDTKANINIITRLWRDMKIKVARYGRRNKHSVGYLTRSMFLMAYEDGNKIPCVPWSSCRSFQTFQNHPVKSIVTTLHSIGLPSW